MKIIKFFYDLETTGLNCMKHSIHQLAGLIEVDGEVVEEVNLKIQPHPKAEIDPYALEVGGVTKEQIMAYPTMQVAYKQLIKLLSRYVDKFDKTDKMYLCGYNNASFDNNFLRVFFELNKDPYMMSWFWPGSLDVMILAAEYLLEERREMPNFQLKTVAKWLGIGVEENKLHEAGYDVYLTREVYKIVTYRDLL